MLVITSIDPQDIIGLFRPIQHDAHVRAYRAEMWLREREAGTARAWAAIAVLQAEMIAAAHKGRCIHA